MATKKAKPTVKSTPAVKKAPKVTTEADAPPVGDVAHAQELAAEKTRKGRDTVLVEYTPNQLAAEIGGDTPIQVGRKSLAGIKRAAILAQHGL